MPQWTQPKQNGESLEKELKNGCCWKKMKEAENNLQKNRLSIGSLFFYHIFLFYSCICKSENTINS
jgi:hypothetical protein